MKHDGILNTTLLLPCVDDPINGYIGVAIVSDRTVHFKMVDPTPENALQGNSFVSLNKVQALSLIAHLTKIVELAE